MFDVFDLWQEYFEIDFNNLPAISHIRDAGENMTYVDAQLYCQDLAGWSLPIPLDQTQNDQIRQKLNHTTAWLGVRGVDGAWYHAYITNYVDFEIRDYFTLPYYNWAVDEPLASTWHAAFMNENGKWETADMDTHLEPVYCIKYRNNGEAKNDEANEEAGAFGWVFMFVLIMSCCCCYRCCCRGKKSTPENKL